MSKNRDNGADTFRVIIEMTNDPKEIDFGMLRAYDPKYHIGVGYVGMSITPDTAGEKSICQFKHCGAYNGNCEDSFKTLMDKICNPAGGRYTIFEDGKKAAIYGRVIRDSDLPGIAAGFRTISGSSKPIYILAYDDVPEDVILRTAMPQGNSNLVSITGQDGICYQIKDGELVASIAKETGFRSKGQSSR